MLKGKLKQFCLLLGDILGLFGCLYLALAARYLQLPNYGLFSYNLNVFIPIFALIVLTIYVSDFYDLKKSPLHPDFYRGFIKNIIIVGILSIIYLYLFPFENLSPKTNLAIFLGIFALFFIVWRRLFYLLLKTSIPKDNLAIIGYNDRVREIMAEIKSHPQLGYAVRLIVVLSQAEKEQLKDYDKNIGVLDSFETLEEMIAKYKINTIIIDKKIEDQTSNNIELKKRLFNCLPLGIKYIDLSNFYEKISGKIPLEIINQGWFLDNINLADKRFYDFFKRIFDLFIAITVLLITIVFWPLIMLMIKFTSRGPIFFTQMRLGKNNIPFRMIKFRTMTVNNNTFGMTKENDTRITRFGSFLRKSRIDELPQMLNILKGDMSFVGPRPERPELVAELESKVPFFAIRTLIKPGITGWDQISGEYHSPTTEDTFKKVQSDLFYIKNRSLYLDLTIILKTLNTIVSRGGR